MPAIGGMGCFMGGGITARIFPWSEVTAVGEAVAMWPLYGGVGLVGEAAWEGGVGRVFGEATDGCMLS